MSSDRRVRVTVAGTFAASVVTTAAGRYGDMTDEELAKETEQGLRELLTTEAGFDVPGAHVRVKVRVEPAEGEELTA